MPGDLSAVAAVVISVGLVVLEGAFSAADAVLLRRVVDTAVAAGVPTRRN